MYTQFNFGIESGNNEQTIDFIFPSKMVKSFKNKFLCDKLITG